MRRTLLPFLCCPGCRQAYRAVAHAEDSTTIDLGYLACDCAATVIPIVDGFVFFTEPILHQSLATADALGALALKSFGTKDDFDRMADEKMSRGVVEVYAAFQPFNESTRALEPLLPALHAVVRPGDLLLDTWCRTGWTGEWLAGAFPQQTVVSLWEGNSSVLGYRGFRHLLGAGRRARNLDVVFAQTSAPLPFADASVAVVHGHDALHRHALYPFAAEAMRVARRDGALVFPHVHLSNTQPEPYFDRGGRIAHGRDYRRWLDGLALEPGRRGFVFSEATLFARSLAPAAAALEDEAETTHYNALLAVLPEARRGAADAALTTSPRVAADVQVASISDGARASRRFLVSPLLEFDFSRSSVRVAPGALHGEVGKLLSRHPVYAERLPKHAWTLDEAGAFALLLSAAGLDESSLLACEVTAESVAAPASMPGALRDLASREVICGAAVSRAGHDLQRYHAHQWTPHDQTRFGGWLARHAGAEAELMILPDGAMLTAGDAVEFMTRVPGALRAFGLAPGDWMGVRTPKHPLVALGACAAAAAGFHVSIDPPSAMAFELHAGESDGADAARVPRGATPIEAFLATMEQTQPVALDALDARGLLELPIDHGRMRCAFADLVAGVGRLGRQCAQRLLVVDAHTTVWHDLVSVMTSLRTGEVLRR